MGDPKKDAENDLNRWYFIALAITVALALVAVIVLFENHLILDEMKEILDHIHKEHLSSIN